MTPQAWDSPGAVWDAPGAFWDPSPAPAPPKPKKKPFYHAPKSNANQPTPSSPTMPTFKYNVAPKTGGGFTTRAVKGDPVSEAELLAAVAAATGVTSPQAEAVIKTFLNKLLACSAGCDWSPNLFGLFNFRPTSGGSSATPDGFHNADDINAGVALSFSAEAIRQWRSTLNLESLGEVGKLTPIIDTIIRQSDLAPDKYTALGLNQMRGDHLGLDPSDATQGIFLKAGAAAEVRVSQYATITPSSVVFLVPDGLSGPLTVRVASYINGSVRSYTYTDPLTTP